MYPNLRVIFDAEKPIRCVFFTLVVRTKAINAKYKGGMKAFVDRYKPQCCKGLAALCAMGEEDLYEPILDIEKNGLVGKDDFACFDATPYVIGFDMGRKMGSGIGSEVRFPLLWLKGHVHNGGVVVYPTDYS